MKPHRQILVQLREILEKNGYSVFGPAPILFERDADHKSWRCPICLTAYSTQEHAVSCTQSCGDKE